MEPSIRVKLWDPSTREMFMDEATLRGTIWDVVESDGTICVFYFEDKGRMPYDSDSDRHENGRWSVDTKGRVLIDTNDHYADYIGTFVGNKVSGDAWNINGLKWTWKGVRRK